MTNPSLSESALSEAPLLHVADTVDDAVAKLLASDMPALPALDERERYAGMFGEREFMGALFPGYLSQLAHAGFVPHRLDEVLEKRAHARGEPISKHLNTEHIEVGSDCSDVQVAEIFFHHHVLVIPVIDDGTVRGVLTHRDFFRALAASLGRRR